MFIIAQHSTSDPERFSSAVQAGMQDLPVGVRLHSSIPSSDGSRATCLWEADSLDAVRTLIEDTVGDVSTTEYYEVDAESALGMPAPAAQSA
jgi:hypothetical protein